MARIRVATLQYHIRPVEQWSEFQNQVQSLVETAADYDCHLIVFPEYFTCQLLTLGDRRSPIHQQIRALGTQAGRFVEMMSHLARENGIHVVAGTIPVLDDDAGTLHNDAYFFNPEGEYRVQGKLHMTRTEAEEWEVSARDRLKVFETPFGRVTIAICYDVEFPELVRAAAHQGVDLLVVPSCTDDRLGFLRVRYCAQARAIENQLYVVHSATVGSLPTVPAVSLNYGQASILTPSDFPFARDGILAEGVPNQESMVIGELDLDTIQESRSFGTVLPLLDSARSRDLAEDLQVESL